MNQTILVTDDEKEIRELLKLYLTKEGYSVVEAEDGWTALTQIAQMKIDLVIIDIMMPELDGYQLIKRLRKDNDIPIIVASAKTANYEKILGLDLGADDYVTKPFDPLEVVARVKAQLRRYTGDTEAVIYKTGPFSLDTSTCMLSYGKQEISLTATEYNIMKLFMQSPGRVFTKQQIYDGAWPENVIVDDNTVMVAISKLRSKLPKEQGALIKTIRGLGYRLEVQK